MACQAPASGSSRYELSSFAAARSVCDRRSGGTARAASRQAASISAPTSSYVNEMEDCGAVYRLHGKTDRSVRAAEEGRRQHRPRADLGESDLDQVQQLSRRPENHPPRSRRRAAGAARFPLFGRLGRRRQADRARRLGEPHHRRAGRRRCTITRSTRCASSTPITRCRRWCRSATRPIPNCSAARCPVSRSTGTAMRG